MVEATSDVRFRGQSGHCADVLQSAFDPKRHRRLKFPVAHNATASMVGYGRLL